MAGILSANPAAAQQNRMLSGQLASLPPDVRNFIVETYQNTQISVLPLPYWSTIAFEASIAANVATIDTSPRKAFAYAIGGSRTIAGFAAGNGTLADTNLLRATETRDNSDVWIWGLSAYKTQGPETDDALTGAVWRETSCEISLNGTQSIPLGTLELFPGAGGLYGQGRSQGFQPPTNIAGQGNGGQGASLPFATNGLPASGNFFRLPQPFKWSAVGSAGSDSSLVITCTPNRAIAVAIAATRAAVPVVAAVTPGTIEPATQPTAMAVAVRWHLHCVAVAKRSVNV